MTDLHTHILPEMDDGAADTAESLALLSAEAAQGVKTVCLTPHFYPEREAPGEFLRRRLHAFDRLRRVLPPDAPSLLLGAEVAFYPTLALTRELEQLTVGGSRVFLLELPFVKWTPRLFDALYRLPDQTGLTPLLAHVERYAAVQGRSRMQELFALGFPMQMNAESLLSGGRRMLSLLREGDFRIASDCHNGTTRPPNLGKAASLLRDKLDADAPHHFTRPLDD